MSDTERLVSFTLLGQEYRFYTGASEEEMDTILTFVRKLIDDTTSGGSAVPANKVAVLACLNVASRYVKLKQEYEDFKNEVEEKLSNLSKEIQDSI